jgi:hypothetical protein
MKSRDLKFGRIHALSMNTTIKGVIELHQLREKMQRVYGKEFVEEADNLALSTVMSFQEAVLFLIER